MRFSECSLGSGASFRGPWRHLTILGRGCLRASAPLSFTEAWAGPSRSGRIQRPLGKSAAEGFLSGVAQCILVLRRIPESRAATSDPSLLGGPRGGAIPCSACAFAARRSSILRNPRCIYTIGPVILQACIIIIFFSMLLSTRLYDCFTHVHVSLPLHRPTMQALCCLVL